MSGRHYIKEKKNIGCPREGQSPIGEGRGGGCPLAKIAQKIKFGQFLRKRSLKRKRKKKRRMHDQSCMTCG